MAAADDLGRVGGPRRILRTQGEANVQSALRESEHYVAVDNYCAWPNLSVLPDGSVGALIFNRPSHGQVEGDVELWVSPDGRAPWTKRSRSWRNSTRAKRKSSNCGFSAD